MARLLHLLPHFVELLADGSSTPAIVNYKNDLHATLYCLGSIDGDEGSMTTSWEDFREVLNTASRTPVLDEETRDKAVGLSRLVVQRWEADGLERLRFAEAVLVAMSTNGNDITSTTDFMQFADHPLLRELRELHVDRFQLNLIGTLMVKPTDLGEMVGGFCAVGYLLALYALMTLTNESEWTERLCEALQSSTGLHWPLTLTWFPGWLTRPEQLLRALDERDAKRCALRPSPNLAATKEAVAHVSDKPKKWRVALWTGHNFAFDVLLASREAAELENVAWEGAIFGYTMQEKYPLAAKNCQNLQHLASTETGDRALCQSSATITRVMDCFDVHVGLGTASGCSLHEVRADMEHAHSEIAFLRQADLLICSYPFAVCAVLGSLASLASLPMLIAVKGAGTLTEYVDASLIPWILSTYQSWLGHGRTQSALAFRKVIVMDRMDTPILRAAFGDAVAPEPVLFGARYVLKLAGGIHCHLRGMKPRSLLIWKLNLMLPLLDTSAVVRLLQDYFTDILGGDTFDWKPTFLGFQSWSYQDLQSYAAVVLIPWDFTLVTFLELLRLGIPVILPSSSYMHALVTTTFWSKQQNSSNWNVRWMRRFSQLVPDHWQGFGLAASNRSVGLVEGSHGSMLDQVSFWWKQTEFANQPSVKNFDHVGEIILLLAYMDTELICRRMQSQTQRALHRSAEFHRQLLRQMA